MTEDPYSMSIPLSKNIVNQIYKYYTDDRMECEKIIMKIIFLKY